METEAASFNPLPPMEHVEKQSPCGYDADRERNGIDFTLTPAQQPGSLFRRGGT